MQIWLLYWQSISNTTWDIYICMQSCSQMTKKMTDKSQLHWLYSWVISHASQMGTSWNFRINLDKINSQYPIDCVLLYLTFIWCDITVKKTWFVCRYLDYLLPWSGCYAFIIGVLRVFTNAIQKIGSLCLNFLIEIQFIQHWFSVVNLTVISVWKSVHRLGSLIIFSKIKICYVIVKFCAK